MRIYINVTLAAHMGDYYGTYERDEGSFAKDTLAGAAFLVAVGLTYLWH